MPPVSQEERERIVAALRANPNAYAAAKQFGRARSTILGIAKTEGIDLDRSATKSATEARRAEAAASRARLAELILDDVHRLREQLWKPCIVYSFGGKENTYNEHELDRPDFRGQQAIMTSVGIGVDKLVALERIDSTSEGEARGLIVALVESLGS